MGGLDQLHLPGPADNPLRLAEHGPPLAGIGTRQETSQLDRHRISLS